MFDRGIDKPRDLVSFATTLGVLIKRGAYYQFEGETIGQGQETTIEVLRSNSELLDKIEKMCYNSVNDGLDMLEDLEDKENSGNEQGIES